PRNEAGRAARSVRAARDAARRGARRRDVRLRLRPRNLHIDEPADRGDLPMNRTPFLILAALAAGVPLAYAFTPCDHKHGCKHAAAVRATVARPGESQLRAAPATQTTIAAPATR